MKLTAPVTDRDHAAGPETAPVTLVEYGDYECPHCGAAYPLVKQIQDRLGERLRFVFRNFPLTQIHSHAEHAADPVIRQAVAEEGAVAAIVLDHEQAHQKARGRQRDQQAEPITDVMQRGPHREPQQRKRQQRDHDLDDAAGAARLAIAAENLRPGARFDNGRGVLCRVQNIVPFLPMQDIGVMPRRTGARPLRW